LTINILLGYINDTYNKLRKYKEMIILNYYYRLKLITYNENAQYDNFESKLEQNERNIVIDIRNEKLEGSNKKNDNIYKQSILFFDSLSLSNVETIMCYTPEVQLDRMSDKTREKLMADYETVFSQISPNKNVDIKFNELLSDVGKNEDQCKSYETLDMTVKEIIKKLKERKVTFGKCALGYFTVYNNLIFHFKEYRIKNL
jgi:hypothetical protein